MKPGRWGLGEGEFMGGDGRGREGGIAGILGEHTGNRCHGEQ
jgi:hypothetical protein